MDVDLSSDLVDARSEHASSQNGEVDVWYVYLNE